MIMSVHEPRAASNTEAPPDMPKAEKLQMYHDQGFFPSEAFLARASNERSTFDRESFLKSDFFRQLKRRIGLEFASSRYSSSATTIETVP